MVKMFKIVIFINIIVKNKLELVRINIEQYPLIDIKKEK